ncbi:MAG: hypothetical protein C0P74_011040 [Gammaproteobacteria bacterium]
MAQVEESHMHIDGKILAFGRPFVARIRSSNCLRIGDSLRFATENRR